MAKPVGHVAISWGRGRLDVPAYRIGKFWAVTQAPEQAYFTITHRSTGNRLCISEGIRFALRLVPILDCLLPHRGEAALKKAFNRLPVRVKIWLRNQT